MGPIEDSWTLHQEVAAQSLLAQMPPEDRAVVKLFADTAGPLLHSFLVDKSKQWRDGGWQFFQALDFLVWVAAALDDWYLECRNLFFYRYRWCISAWDNLPQAGKDCSGCVMYSSLVRWNHSCGLQLSSFGPKTLLSLGGWQFFQALDFLVWVAAALDDWYLECRNLFFYRYRWCISAWDNLPQAGKDCSGCVIYILICMYAVYIYIYIYIRDRDIEKHIICIYT